MLTWKEVEKISEGYDCSEYVKENQKMCDRVRGANKYLESVQNGSVKPEAEKVKIAKKVLKGVITGKTEELYRKTFNSKIKSMLKKDFRTLNREDIEKIFLEVKKVYEGAPTSEKSSPSKNVATECSTKAKSTTVRKQSANNMFEVPKDSMRSNPVYDEYMMYRNSLMSASESGFWADITKHPFYNKFVALKGKLGM